MTRPSSPEETAPIWIAVLLVAILAVTMFAAGFMLGSRYGAAMARSYAFEPSISSLKFEADSGVIRGSSD